MVISPGGTAAVIGGSGFVGAAICASLGDRGWTVRPVRAPRLRLGGDRAADAFLREGFQSDVDELAGAIASADVLVNAAGDPNASSGDLDGLMGVNAALPSVALRAAKQAGVPRFVHVSSSVVQGDRPVLDSSEQTHGFSPYSISKATGERWVLAEAEGHPEVIIYRPPSVHAPGRGVTRKIASLASSPLSSVAGVGDRPSPQALLENVGDAVAFLATSEPTPPRIVHHPWEGLTTAELLRLLGGREPHHIPEPLARGAVNVARGAERVIPSLAPNRRRIELLLLGQGVGRSWLEEAGWHPPHGADSWRRLATNR